MKIYRSFVHALIDSEYESPLVELLQSVILGSSEFVDAIRDRFLRGKQVDRDLTNRPGIVVSSAGPAWRYSEKKSDSTAYLFAGETAL